MKKELKPATQAFNQACDELDEAAQIFNRLNGQRKLNLHDLAELRLKLAELYAEVGDCLGLLRKLHTHAKAESDAKKKRVRETLIPRVVKQLTKNPRIRRLLEESPTAGPYKPVERTKT